MQIKMNKKTAKSILYTKDKFFWKGFDFMYKTVSVIGGDLRQLTLAKMLSQEGYLVSVYGFGKDSLSENYNAEKDIQKAVCADVIILPVPVTLDSKKLNAPFHEETIALKELSDIIKKDSLVLGGRISKEVYDLFEGYKIIDYYKREELMIKNAVPTAEGAIEIAMGETPVTISDSKCLVVGYGRIGKVLSRLLQGLGADVYVSARKYSDLAWADVWGYRAIHNDEIKDCIQKQDVIFNTVPALILDEDILKRINPDSVIIDLASKPGGVDFQKAKDLGLKVIWALSLPGKCAPITSGKIIKETITNILKEEG